MPSPHQQALAEQLKHIFGEHPAPKVLADAGSYSYIDDGDPPTFFPFGDCQLPDAGRDPYEDWFGRNNADAARA